VPPEHAVDEQLSLDSIVRVASLQPSHFLDALFVSDVCLGQPNASLQLLPEAGAERTL
jgi:hypothetical protein